MRNLYREQFFPALEMGQNVSPATVGKRLKTRVDEPVRGDGVTLILRCRKSTKDGHAPAAYWVETKADPGVAAGGGSAGGDDAPKGGAEG